MAFGRIRYVATHKTPARSPYSAPGFYAMAFPWAVEVAAGEIVDLMLDWGYTKLYPHYKDQRTLTTASAGVSEVRHINTDVSHKFSVSEVLDTTAREQLQNGTFEMDILFSKGTGWSIANGLATSDGSQAATSDLISAGAPLSNATLYQVQVNIDSLAAGNVTIILGGQAGVAQAVPGKSSQYILAGGADIVIRASADFVGSVDAVSVLPAREVSDYAALNALNNELAKGTPMRWWPNYTDKPYEYYAIIGNKRIAPRRSHSRHVWSFDFDVLVVPAIQSPSTIAPFVAA